MKNTILVLLVLAGLSFMVACGGPGEGKNGSNGTTEVKTMTDADLLTFLWKTPQKGWIKEGYTKDNFYYICFSVDYNDKTKPSMIDIYDSNSASNGKYDWTLENGTVTATGKYDKSELTLKIEVIGDDAIMINGEKYIPLSNKEATELQTK